MHLDVRPWREFDLSAGDICGIMFQYPDTNGHIEDFSALVKEAKQNKVGLLCSLKLVTFHVFTGKDYLEVFLFKLEG